MSERYRESCSWQPRHHLTAADKHADACGDSKHQGMLRAVQQQLLQPTIQSLESGNAQHLPNKEQLKEQAEQRAEQQAVEALDQLQVALGRMAGVKQKGGRLSVGKPTVCGLRAVYSLWDQVKANEPRASGAAHDGRRGRIQLTKGAATPVPELPELTMAQIVMAATEAGMCPLQPLSWWFSN
jgi:hypothetical protein